MSKRVGEWVRYRMSKRDRGNVWEGNWEKTGEDQIDVLTCAAAAVTAAAFLRRHVGLDSSMRKQIFHSLFIRMSLDVKRPSNFIYYGLPLTTPAHFG